MIYNLYIATIALLCSGILFGVLSALLAIINTAYNPSEAICHIPGIILNFLDICSVGIVSCTANSFFQQFFAHFCRP